MLKYIINLIFPPKCIFCRRVLGVASDIDICPDCYSKIPFLRGGILESPLNNQKGYCDEVIAVCRYSGIVRNALINYKFNDKSSFYKALGKLMSERVKKMTNYRNFDIIASVPLFKQRQNVRGYNQAALMAKEISKELGIPNDFKLLFRKRNTKSQSLLSRQERLENLRDAFEVKEINKVKGKNIILIDDVLTTGSTLNECGKALKIAGAGKIAAIVMATGRKF
jgi:competence protein ComFC